MRKKIGVCLAVCLGLLHTGCGTIVLTGAKTSPLPKTRPEGAGAYCVFVSTQVLEESRGAIRGTGYSGRLADSRLNLYAHNIFWALDYSSDDFADITQRLQEIGFDSPIVAKPEHLPYFAGSPDGRTACYVKKYVSQ